MPETFHVASSSELPPGTMRRVQVADAAICLARTEDGAFYAIQDGCTHEGESLSEGWLEGATSATTASNP